MEYSKVRAQIQATEGLISEFRPHEEGYALKG